MMINGPMPPQQQQQQSYDGSIRISVTLPLATWEMIRVLMGKADEAILSDPLINELRQQISTVLERDHKPVQPA